MNPGLFSEQALRDAGQFQRGSQSFDCVRNHGVQKAYLNMLFKHKIILAYAAQGLNVAPWNGHPIKSAKFCGLSSTNAD